MSSSDIEQPSAFKSKVEGFFPVAHTPSFDISLAEDGGYLLRFESIKDTYVVSDLGDAVELIDAKLRRVPRAPDSGSVLLNGGLVGWGNKSVLILSEDDLAVAMTVACLVDQGFSYLAQHSASLGRDGHVCGYTGPFSTPTSHLQWLSELSSFRDAVSLRGTSRVFVAPRQEWLAPHGGLKPAAIVVATRTPMQSPLRIGVVDDEAFGTAIESACLSNSNVRLARQKLACAESPLPRISLSFDVPRTIGDAPARLLRFLVEEEMDHPAFERHIASIAPPVQKSPAKPLHDPTPRCGRFKLTIGMATYDDFDGVYFTIQSIRLNNPELMKDVEFVVVDNNPTGLCAEALKKLEKSCASYRYVPYVGQSGTATRDRVFDEAQGDFVMCLDCHVLLAPGVLSRVMSFIDANPTTADLFQGPLVNDAMEVSATRFTPIWQNGMYGVWGLDEQGKDVDAPPFEIPMQGLGLFLCRREIWPGFNPKFSGFGGEEGYIHEKFRQRGGRTICLPFLRWLHRFPRPMGVPYRLKWEDRVRNYYLGFLELGMETAQIKEHFTELLGAETTHLYIEDIRSELDNPLNRFDMLTYINHDAEAGRRATLTTRLEALGAERLFKRFAAITTPDSHQQRCVLSHRAIIADARRRSLQNVLVLEDDVVFHKDTLELLPRMLDELDNIEWDIFYLGGQIDRNRLAAIPGRILLKSAANQILNARAVVYNLSSFERILDEIPDEIIRSDESVSIMSIEGIAGLKKVVADPVLALPTSQLASQDVSNLSFKF